MWEEEEERKEGRRRKIDGIEEGGVRQLEGETKWENKECKWKITYHHSLLRVEMHVVCNCCAHFAVVNISCGCLLLLIVVPVPSEGGNMKTSAQTSYLWRMR